MRVKHLHARAMEASLAETVVARVCIGRQDAPTPQMRDHSHSARAATAVGKDGLEAVQALLLPVAKDHGCADVGRVSADPTAQELPIGSPTEPGLLRGVAQRCGRAWATRTARGVLGGATALPQVETILRSVTEPQLFATGKAEKRPLFTRRLTAVGQLVGQTRGVASAAPG
jgi:hypothetical protein